MYNIASEVTYPKTAEPNVCTIRDGLLAVTPLNKEMTTITGTPMIVF
jgi:hypothetical protein